MLKWPLITSARLWTVTVTGKMLKVNRICIPHTWSAQWRLGWYYRNTKSPCFRATSHVNHQWWRQSGARRGHWRQTKAKVTGRWWGRGRQGERVKEGERRRRRWWRGWQEQCKGKGQQRQWGHLHLSRGWARVELLAQTSSSTLQGDVMLYCIK